MVSSSPGMNGRQAVKVTSIELGPQPLPAPQQRYRDCSGFQGDVRFRDYADMLHAGDILGCEEFCKEHVEDPEILRKVRTLERQWVTEMSRLVRELQITARESLGYRTLSEGYCKQAYGTQASTWVKRKLKAGNNLLRNADAARLDHERVEVPVGFKK